MRDRIVTLLGTLLGAVVLLVPTLALAQIRNTMHDLSNTSTATVKSDVVTNDEICKFCHTAHAATSSQLVWNHTKTAQAVFSWGNDLDGVALTKTSAGTTLATSLAGRSKLCLGCHDGSIGVGSVYNVGGGVAGTMSIPTIVNETNATDQLLAAGGSVVGAAGNLGGAHPVSIPYAAEGPYNTITSKVPVGQVDNAIGNFWKVKTAGCASASGICTEATGAPMNGLAINLIADGIEYGIECASCHEPHRKYANTYFLRVDNTNQSGLCRSCHNK